MLSYYIYFALNCERLIDLPLHVKRNLVSCPWTLVVQNDDNKTFTYLFTISLSFFVPGKSDLTKMLRQTLAVSIQNNIYKISNLYILVFIFK